MLVLVLFMLPFASCNKSIDYLTYYGYLNKNSLTEDITPAVKQFQLNFRLEPTGVFDNETLELMATPRCGHKDEILPFSALPDRKWNTSVITWYQYGTPQQTDLIQKAFNVWAKHANITFKNDVNNPTIYISFSTQRQHVFYSRQDICPYNFDGPGYTLAHAYLPNPGYNQTDIHLDSEENWDFTMELPRYGNISFFHTLVHEIGHTLGLSHSGDDKSVMFPFNRDPKGIVNFNEFELSRDDRLAMQFLYGLKNQSTFTKNPFTNTTTISTPTTPSTTTSSTTTTTTPTPNTTSEVATEFFEKREVCELKSQIDTYVIANKRIFAFFRDYVWIISLDPKSRIPEEYFRPRKVQNWLPFLPYNFTEISAIYQRPNGEVALFIKNDIYLFRYPSLAFVRKYNASAVAGRQVHKVNAAFSTNQGKTYMIINDWYLIEIDECSYTGVFMGMVSSNLYGVPAHVRGAFKYINGNIYFLTDSGALEFNDYTNSVTRTLPDAFEALNIPCMRETLLNKLYEVIRYLQ